MGGIPTANVWGFPPPRIKSGAGSNLPHKGGGTRRIWGKCRHMIAHGIPPGVITIDLAVLRANWQALARLVAPAECGAVVKADAYGLGANEVIPALWRAGCRTFFIATNEEAKEARGLAPEATIYALDGLMPGAAAALLEARARPVLSSLDEVREWAAVEGRPPAALHVDTGLNRLGLGCDAMAALTGDAALLSRLDLGLVMSHLACADDPAPPMNERQLAAFNAARALLPLAPASLAASDGLMLGREYHFDLVRPGYALYGGQASKDRPAPVKSVVQVQARILQIRDVEPGGIVGYSASYTASGRRRIATVAAGYADGFARAASATNTQAGGSVMIGGRRAPVIGRVSMDLITVDVTGLGDAGVARGDWVDLVGPDLTLEEIGARAGTIGYEVLTRLGRRFERVHVGREG